MRGMNSNFVIATGAAFLLASASWSALAASYPVSGKWTYEDAASAGPAQTCDTDRRVMEFVGQRRFDTGGGVPDYRNVSIQQTDIAEYRIVDDFFTGQIRGRANYTLRLVDPDHIEIEMAGKIIALRRCV